LPRLPLRPGVERVADMLGRGVNVVFMAPTGYGKSKSVNYFMEAVGDRVVRAVHVLPLRALVRELYKYYVDVLGEGYVGFVAGIRSLPRPDYSPFFLRRLTVSTIDSFALSLARLPLIELAKVSEGVSKGHYELPRMGILSSLVVFDEAHLYAESAEQAGINPARIFLEESTGWLSSANVPVLVESATMPPSLVASLRERLGGRRAGVVVVCRKCGGPGYVRVYDREFSELHSYEWETELVGGFHEAVEKCLEEAETGRRVLFVANTVRDAVNAYREIGRAVGDVVLVHGRLAAGDRAAAEERIRSARVIVATQVVEAGVDVDADVLVTAAATPSALAQRAGRLYRSRAPSRETEPPKVYIYRPRLAAPYPGKAVNETLKQIKDIVEARGERIDWRLLDSGGDRKSYYELIVNVEDRYLGRHTPTPMGEAFRLMLSSCLSGLLVSSGMSLRLLNSFCSLVRPVPLVGLAVPLGGDYDVVEVSLAWLSRNTGVLDCSDGGCRALVAVYSGGGQDYVEVTIDEQQVRRLGHASRASLCEAYNSLVASAINRAGVSWPGPVLLLVREGVYKRGIGLV